MKTNELTDKLIALALGKLVKVVLAKLVTRLPFMSWGPLSWLASIVITKVLEAAAEQTDTGIRLLIINMDVLVDVKQVNDIREKAKLDEGYSDEQIDKDLEDALDVLHFSSTASRMRDKGS